MSGANWDPVETGGAEPVPVKVPTSLISLHFMVSAVVRHRWLVASCALIGLCAGLALAVLAPQTPVATASVLLTRDQNVNPDRGVATDLALATTEQVLGRVADQLHLGMTAAEFGKTVTVTKVTDDVVHVTVSGPSDVAAMVRADAVAGEFLRFRADTLTQQAQVIAATLRSRIAELSAQVDSLTTRVNNANAADATKLSDLVAQRTQTTSRIDSLQDQVQTALLSATSVSATSRLLDAATHTTAKSLSSRIAVDGVGGLLAGAALSTLLVVVAATMSWRVRRREDVAEALDAPVRSLRGRRRLGARERQLLVDIVGDLALNGRALGWVTVGTPKLSARLLQTVAQDLVAAGRQVLLVDLSGKGMLVEQSSPPRRWRRQRHGTVPLLVPDGDIALTRGPLSRAAAPAERSWQDHVDRYADADLILALATVDPAIGADHLRTWVDGAVVTVATGACTPERLHTAAQLLRAAAVTVHAGLLLDSDRDDESLGLPYTGPLAESPVRAVAQ